MFLKPSELNFDKKIEAESHVFFTDKAVLVKCIVTPCNRATEH